MKWASRSVGSPSSVMHHRFPFHAIGAKILAATVALLIARPLSSRMRILKQHRGGLPMQTKDEDARFYLEYCLYPYG